MTFSSSTLVTGKLNVICLYEEKTWPQWLKKKTFFIAWYLHTVKIIKAESVGST